MLPTCLAISLAIMARCRYVYEGLPEPLSTSFRAVGVFAGIVTAACLMLMAG